MYSGKVLQIFILFPQEYI